MQIQLELLTPPGREGPVAPGVERRAERVGQRRQGQAADRALRQGRHRPVGGLELRVQRRELPEAPVHAPRALAERDSDGVADLEKPGERS